MTFSLTFSHLRGNFTSWGEDTALPHPYVVFKAGGQKTQTKALKNVGGVGEWRESYTLYDIPEKSGSLLEVIVMTHKTILPDDTVGSGSVNISNWSSQELTGQGEVITQLVDKKGRGVGTLSFHAKHSNFTVEAARRSVGAMPVQQFQGTDSRGGRVDGLGVGTTYDAAKEAAAKAAAEKRNVTVENPTGVAAGKPVGYGNENVASQNVLAGQHPGTALRRDMQYERGPVVSGGNPEAGGGLQGKAGVPQYETGHKAGLQNGSATDAITTGIAGVDVKQGEVIDRKFYTGREERPQEQVLVERFREHHPYVKKYETTVAHTGRERQIGSRIETLGTEELITNTQNNVNLPPHQALAKTLPPGGSEQALGGDGWVQTEWGPICDTKKFEITGDVTVDKKRVTNLREHRDFEKEFEIKTTFIEEIPQADKHFVEQLSRERVLRNEKEKVACEGHQGLHNLS